MLRTFHHDYFIFLLRKSEVNNKLEIDLSRNIHGKQVEMFNELNMCSTFENISRAMFYFNSTQIGPKVQIICVCSENMILFFSFYHGSSPTKATTPLPRPTKKSSQEITTLIQTKHVPWMGQVVGSILQHFCIEPSLL